MRYILIIMLFVIWTLVESSRTKTVLAEEDVAAIKARLEQLPQPWQQRVHRITAEEYEATLRYWASEHADVFTLERRRLDREGEPIFLVKITDSNVAAKDKQVCLISALHCGPERSGTTTIMHLIEWLVSDSPEAVETRRKQVVLLMPIVNPYAFFETDRFGNSLGIDPYTGGGAGNWDFSTMTYKALDKSPEIEAYLSVVDEYQPEVHADVHGTGLQEYAVEQLGDRTRYQGQMMFEVTGSAYSNYALRPWDWRFTEAIIAAGEAEGYPSDRFEADAQRGYWGPGLNGVSDRLWRGRPNFYTAQYGYIQYHTMVSTFEVSWEASGVARLRGLLQLGNQKWIGEQTAGYPVDRVKALIGNYVTAWGNNASERRQSRVALWQRQGEFSQGLLYPQTEGRVLYVVAMNDRAAQTLDGDKQQFVENLKTMPAIRADAIEAFIDVGPEIKLYVERGRPNELTKEKPAHGLGLRFRIPYRNPTIVDLRLNGHSLQESSTDGYQTWFGDGQTQVQIHVPPDKMAKSELFVVTCAYKPDVKRSYGWEPPVEVIEKLQQTK